VVKQHSKIVERGSGSSFFGILPKVFEPILGCLAFATIVTCTHYAASQKRNSGQHVLSEPSASGTPSASENVSERSISNVEKTKDNERTSLPIIRNGGEKLPLWANAVSSYRSGRSAEPLRVLWFGDSHAAADYWPDAVRKSISRVLPLGGPGYLSLGVPNYRHGMARLWRDGSMELSPHPASRRSIEGDGIFGLGGTRVALKDSTAVVSIRLSFEGASSAAMNYELHYRATSDADRLMLTVGSVRKEFGKANSVMLAGGLSTVRFEASGKDTVEIRSLGGNPQLFGIVAETKTPGVVIDTLGINGARYGTFLAWEKESFAALVSERKPLVAVVAYGTNEVFDDEKVTRHEERLAQVIERLRSAVPDIGCIVAGPTDVNRGGETSKSRVVAIDQAERSTAERLGCVYFSPYDVMTAEGGYEGWSRQSPPLALSDGVHLTARGYSRLGDELARRCLMFNDK
jgi:lysophospholipase L1-like esterase